ncbi:unnamed protein product [Plutella xylostella]|uniref:(diamondback moth) hypothetical protein n=1 Tax=Plutella xylostella TaxID=51655 RepID=A0A8S4DME8_PLUXY|nr:unnamed protein product [Plutella xylostella]
MRCLVLLLFVAAATAGVPSDADYIKNYHELVGIPMATRVKAMEDQWLRNPLNRIIGGAASANINHPYMAGLVITMVNKAQSGCGATLLSSSRVVTAAHCWADSVNQAAQFEVVLGSQYLFSGGTRIVTTQVYTHPSYNPRISAIKYDVAMVYLPSRIAFNGLIAPVALPSAAEANDQFARAMATAIGYGRTSDTASWTLQTYRREVNAQVMNQMDCKRSWQAGTIEPYHLCTEGNKSNTNVNNVGVCGGDSGGPLTTFKNGRQILIGIISFSAPQCEQGHSSGYTRVTSFLNFITQHMIL